MVSVYSLFICLSIQISHRHRWVRHRHWCHPRNDGSDGVCARAHTDARWSMSCRWNRFGYCSHPNWPAANFRIHFDLDRAISVVFASAKFLCWTFSSVMASRCDSSTLCPIFSACPWPWYCWRSWSYFCRWMLVNRRPICRRPHLECSTPAFDSIDPRPTISSFANASVRASIADSIGSAPTNSIWWCCAWTRVWCSPEFVATRLWWIRCGGDAANVTFEYCCWHFCRCCCCCYCCSMRHWPCCSCYCCSCAIASMCVRRARGSRWHYSLSRFSHAEWNRSHTNSSSSWYCGRV